MVYRTDVRCDGKTHTFLLRLYGHTEDQGALVSKEHEISVFAKLAEASLGPPLIATFANGRVEGWIDGRAMTNVMCGVILLPVVERFL